MSVVLVTGGSGTLGRSLVAALRSHHAEIRVLSRRPGVGTHRGDLTTGVGVSAAAEGADLVLHAASDTHRLGRRDGDQTRRLLSVSGEVRHLLYISIVGIDRLPFAYYRQKLACETLIAESGVPFSILRATQFHELIAMILGGLSRLRVAPLPLDFRVQSIAAHEVADRAAALLAGAPRGGIEEIGGPEVLTVGQMAGIWRRKHHRPKVLVPLPIPGRAAAGFREGRNTCPEHAFGRQRWEEFVSAL